MVVALVNHGLAEIEIIANSKEVFSVRELNREALLHDVLSPLLKLLPDKASC